MTGFFLFLIPVSLVIAAVVALLFFLEGAFNPHYAPVTSLPGWRRLPLLRGAELRKWAAREARQVVAGYARRSRQVDTPLDVAHEVEDFTSEVMEESLAVESVERGNHCLQKSRELIGVTVPETLAIVDDLKRGLSPRELHKILKRAKSNEHQLAAAAVRDEATAELPTCPLLAESGCCLTKDSRPIQCRCSCSLCAAATDAVEEDPTGPAEAGFAATIGAGIAEGFSDGLASAGWDGRRYELNGALARALELPDAADRWSRGEAVFANCRGI